MNNSYAGVDLFGKLLDKLPNDFFEKHPFVVVGGCVIIIVLPYFWNGIKYINDSWVSCYQFKIAAENGLIPKRVFKDSNVRLLEDDTAA